MNIESDVTASQAQNCTTRLQHVSKVSLLNKKMDVSPHVGISQMLDGYD